MANLRRHYHLRRLIDRSGRSAIAYEMRATGGFNEAAIGTSARHKPCYMAAVCRSRSATSWQDIAAAVLRTFGLEACTGPQLNRPLIYIYIGIHGASIALLSLHGAQHFDMSTHVNELQDGIVPAEDVKNLSDIQQVDDVARITDEKNFMREEADRAEVYEHNLSTFQAFKTYKAVSTVHLIQ